MTKTDFLKFFYLNLKTKICTNNLVWFEDSWTSKFQHLDRSQSNKVNVCFVNIWKIHTPLHLRSYRWTVQSGTKPKAQLWLWYNKISAFDGNKTTFCNIQHFGRVDHVMSPIVTRCFFQWYYQKSLIILVPRLVYKVETAIKIVNDQASTLIWYVFSQNKLRSLH